MKAALIDNGSENIDLNDSVFGVDFNETLVHQAVVTYTAGLRSGTKAQKNRSAVRGGGAKPWKQKGTGRARAGTSRGPIWRSGGVTFAAQPRDYSKKMNKKMYRGAMRSIFSELVREEAIGFVSDISLSAPKTKEAVALLEKLDAKGGALFVVTEHNSNLDLSTRNLYATKVLTVSELNPYDLVNAPKVICTTEAASKIEEWLQ